MTDTLCECGQPVHNSAIVCTDCLDRAATALMSIPDRREDGRWIQGLAGDLQDAITRQTRLGTGNGGRSNERPVPFDPKASAQHWSLHACLTGWVKIVAEGRGIPYDAADNLEALAHWLAPSVTWLGQHEQAAEFVDEITDEVRQAQRIVDRPAARLYAGPCQEPLEDDPDTLCEAELYAWPGAMTVTCRGCTARHDVADRRRWMLEAAEDFLAPIGQIAAALTSWGEPVKPERLRKWVERGRLIPHGRRQYRGREQALYRFGDARDLLTESDRRKASA